MPDIVDDEIALTQRMIALLGDNPDRLLVMFDVDAVMGAPGPDFINRLQQRIVVMQRHRDDPPAVAPAFRTTD